MSCFVAFHYRSYGTFFLHKNKLHNIHRGFTHYKYYRASFFNDVEAAYEGKVEAKKLLDSYKGFKAVVPSKSEEKRLGREFETVSGYSLYRAVQAAKEKGEGKISLGK